VQDLFGFPWDELTIDRLRVGLATAGDETADWEAKGTEIHRDHVTRAVAAFANAEGGYLVIGARGDREGYVADGAILKTRTGGKVEPGPWLDHHIARVRPCPPHKIRAWTLESGLHVAVIRIEPVRGAVCVVDTKVFVRRHGFSEPVEDGRELIDLVHSRTSGLSPQPVRAPARPIPGSGRSGEQPLSELFDSCPEGMDHMKSELEQAAMHGMRPWWSQGPGTGSARSSRSGTRPSLSRATRFASCSTKVGTTRAGSA
jgi:hypothetical protein